MKKNHKNSLTKDVGIALAVMMIGTLVSSALPGFLTGKEIIPEAMATMAGNTLSEGLVFAICYWIARKLTKNRLLIATIMAGVFALFRLLVGTIVFPEAKLRLLHCVLTVLIGVAAGLMAGMKKQRRR